MPASSDMLMWDEAVPSSPNRHSHASTSSWMTSLPVGTWPAVCIFGVGKGFGLNTGSEGAARSDMVNG